jgi:hypothetical protein
VHCPEHPGDDEADQGHDRERHVHVEDLLDEALVGIVRRVEEDKRDRRGKHRRRGERQLPESPAEKRRVQVNPP